MIVTIDVTMDYALEPGDPVLLALAVLPSPAQTILHSDLQVQDAQLSWLDQAGAAGQRVWVLHEGVRLLARYAARVQISRAAPLLDRLSAVPMHDLPTEALAALRPSLFCPSDRFGPFVQDRFGHLSGGRDDRRHARLGGGQSALCARRVRCCDHRAGHIRHAAGGCAATMRICFVPLPAPPGGVPARYVSGYSPSVTPPDFHACAEVWLEGGWQLVDPTGMSTPGNFAVIASGRDAGDVAFMETAGWATVVRQEVRVG